MSLRDRKVDADREWITIHGRKILWNIFICVFDGIYFRNKFNHIIGEERDLSRATIFQIKDILTIGESKFKEILGIVD